MCVVGVGLWGFVKGTRRCSTAVQGVQAWWLRGWQCCAPSQGLRQLATLRNTRPTLPALGTPAGKPATRAWAPTPQRRPGRAPQAFPEDAGAAAYHTGLPMCVDALAASLDACDQAFFILEGWAKEVSTPRWLYAPSKGGAALRDECCPPCCGACTIPHEQAARACLSCPHDASRAGPPVAHRWWPQWAVPNAPSAAGRPVRARPRPAPHPPPCRAVSRLQGHPVSTAQLNLVVAAYSQIGDIRRVAAAAALRRSRPVPHARAAAARPALAWSGRPYRLAAWASWAR